MKFPDLGRFFQMLAKAAADLKANAPRAAVAKPTGAELVVGLTTLQARLPILIAWAQANPGALTAADDVLEFFETEGASWALPVRTALDATPNGLTDAQQWLPMVLLAMGEMGPAATGIQGDDHRVGRG